MCSLINFELQKFIITVPCVIAVKIVKFYDFVYFSAMADCSVMVKILNEKDEDMNSPLFRTVCHCSSVDN